MPIREDERNMTTQVAAEPDPPITLRTRPAVDLSDDEFFRLCQVNGDLRLERTAAGEIVIMPPAGWETGYRNLELSGQVRDWARRDGSGVAVDSSAGFRLPNGATRSPDVAWVRRERLVGLTSMQLEKFLPLCPDFVIELRSPSDRLGDLRAKMDEYLANGAALGWLIDPSSRTAYVFRPSAAVDTLMAPDRLSGDPELPGLVVELAEIWQPAL
jgi:Uma2 family endonuclease